MLGGRLWHAGCQAANADLPEGLPLAFGSAAEYIRAFEPLLCEEAREAVRGGWAEAAEAGRAWPADVAACAPAPARARLACGDGRVAAARVSCTGRQSALLRFRGACGLM